MSSQENNSTKKPNSRVQANRDGLGAHGAQQNSAAPSGARQEEQLLMSPPWTVKVISGVMFLMALVMMAVVVLYVLDFTSSSPIPMGGRIFFLLLPLAAGVLAALSGLKILKARRWTRAFIVMWHLFQTILATQILFTLDWPIGLFLIIPAALALVLMFIKPTHDFFAANLDGIQPQA